MAVMLIPSSSVSSTFLRMTRTLTSQIYWYEIDLKIVCQTHGKENEGENEGRHPLVSTPFM
ncbi:hypothetical protein OUZ56_005677 [Daphnia magna]|uniref:Uncharacterized protein n=1 Tax=Daphnia magna TaxID=35525 RepID=A0ABQ9YTG3_9CRUS|nr:hypothetical protein OUZ56_005677 [Daphnia magna]